MIIPVGGGMNQELVLLRKHGDKIEKTIRLARALRSDDRRGGKGALALS